MKKLLYLLLLTSISSRADLERKEEPTVGNPAVKNILWFRDGAKIMTECPRDGNRSVLVTITPINVELGRNALTLSFLSGRISRIEGGPALQTCSFRVSDETADGILDFIQITDIKSKKLIEAYIIINGVVEPIPSKILESHRAGAFFEDDSIVRFIKDKAGEQGMDGNPH